MTDKRCGTCVWWSPGEKLNDVGSCEWEPDIRPQPYVATIIQVTFCISGLDCPCWTPKEATDGNTNTQA